MEYASKHYKDYRISSLGRLKCFSINYSPASQPLHPSPVHSLRDTLSKPCAAFCSNSSVLDIFLTIISRVVVERLANSRTAASSQFSLFVLPVPKYHFSLG